MTLIYLLLLLNLITFCTFAWDKYCAIRNRWRIPERTLLFLALIGGSIGALFAQRLLRHKTIKQPFAGRLRLILLGHGLFVAILLGLWVFG